MTLPFMEPIHIIGSGAIGLHWASSIRRAFPSYPLRCIFRDRHRSSPVFVKETASASASAESFHVSINRDVNAVDEQIYEKEFVVCTRQNYSSKRELYRDNEFSSKSKYGGTGKVSFRVGGSGSSPTRKPRRQPPPRMARVPFQFISDDNHNRRKIQNLLVCTKAFQAKDAILSVLPRLDATKAARIILLSNGALDIHDQLLGDDEFTDFCRTKIQPELVFGTTTIGVSAEKDDHLGTDMFHLSERGEGGKTYIGGNPALARLWDQSGLAAQSIPQEEMGILLWHKLAANCLLNPLTAIWDATNGELSKLHPESFVSMRKQIVKEVSSVAIACQQKFGEESPRCSALLTPQAFDDFVESVINANGKNTSSLHRDVQHGQPTEVENLNGYIVRKGQEIGIPTPANEELLQKVLQITSASK